MLYHFLLDSMVSDEKSIILWHECQVFSYTPTIFEALFTFFIVWFFCCSYWVVSIVLSSSLPIISSCYLHSAVEPVTEFLFCLLLSFNSKISTWFFMFSISLLRFSVCFFFICLKHVHDCFLKHFCDGRFKSLSDNFNIWFVFHVSVYWLSFLTPSREL